MKNDKNKDPKDLLKIDNCFIDEQPDFEYQIKLGDRVVATAHMQSAEDKSVIQRNSYRLITDANGNFVFDKNGNPTPEIDFYLWNVWTILRALTSWSILDKDGKVRDLDYDAVIHLPENVRAFLFSEIKRHEDEFALKQKAYQKN